MITPSNPQEAKDYTVIGTYMSEELKLPVILRTTTRVNHTVGNVRLGKPQKPKKFSKFVRDPPRFVRAGMRWNLERHKWLNNQLSKVEDVANKYGLNSVFGDGDVCIVTEGTAFNYVMESLRILGLMGRVKVLKLGLIHPIPSKFLAKELSSCSKVIVIEELDPYLEIMTKKVVFGEGLNVKVIGKEEGLLPLEGELSTHSVLKALAKELGKEVVSYEFLAKTEVPPRPPPLCPSCPHRHAYIAILKGIEKAGFRKDEVPIFGDIGCYALSVNPPLNAIWTEHSMGASISMAIGLKLSGFEGPVIATIGDSTFYHAGIQPLIEAVHKRVNVLVVILDNAVVAMTGHQSTPEWSVTESGRKTKAIDIESLVKGIGVDNVAVVDPYDIDGMAELVAKYLRTPGVNVIIAKHPCALMESRIKGVSRRFTVDVNKCIGCLSCIRNTGCPALSVGDDGKARILIEDCLGCGLCAKFCPVGAIKEVK